MGSATPLHVLVFPFMAQGHTLPMLDLSKLLARCGIKVTIITTPENFPELRGPLGVESTVDLPSEDLRAPFIEAIKKLKEPFEEILRGMFEAGCPPIGVILDFFLGWMLDSCNSFGIPRIVTYGMSALSQAILITSGFHTQYILASLPEDPVQFPELPTPFQVTRADFLHLKHDPRSSLMSSIVQEFT
ncbi:UDP-glycosyltransferase 73D1-like [Vitis riparia]|uniref:UDP-glycosyltransferase 73D1-like n=1 Tax=Vitis riparia TaxID=96939 RepID=UPI00155A5F68|nr:UDP-glycosyltransferase 73D1-like [Vitis riparia]